MRTERSALGLTLAFAALAVAQRVEIPFSYNWRHKWTSAWAGPDGIPGPYGSDNNVAPLSGYWTVMPGGYDCSGPVEQNPNRFNASDCATACAYNPDCLVWQHSDERHCVHGFAGYECAAGSSHYSVGGTRTPEQAAVPVKTDYAWADPSFDDTQWEVVSAPHDSIIEAANFSAGADSFHGFIDRNGTIWYRKTFAALPSWEGNVVFVRFEGVFHFATVWLNGKALATRGNVQGGYSEFTVRLDNATSGPMTGSQVLAVRVDASYGSGHWYEGGGLTREVQLVTVPAVHAVEDGLFVSPEVPVSAASATSIPVSLELENLGGAASAAAEVAFTLEPLDGGTAIATQVVHVTVPATTGVPVAETVTAKATLTAPAGSIKAWSVSNGANLYRVAASVAVSGSPTDAVSTVTGFRSTNATVDSKYVLNDEHFELRGFSHHNSFAAVGVAMPARLDLFRAQQSKAMGANFWRMSHNPYRRSTYEILDRLGLVVWDEHRDYGEVYVPGVYDMVKRSRNRPSVIMWSFCNEYECGGGTNETGALFRKACKSLSPNRPTVANGNPNGGGIDIQGHSHSGNSTFISFHNSNPFVPQILSECCSCSSQRLPPVSRGLPDCIANQNSPGLLPFVLGSTGVWTAFDYFGESHDWPAVSSSYGQFSIAGFPKPHAFWYRANWLASRPMSDPGRPMQPALHEARVLELGDMLSPSGRGFEIRAVTDSPSAELFVDGVSLGAKPTAGSYPGQVAMVSWVANASRPACAFPVNRSGDQCHGLNRASAESPSSCMAACCASEACNTWQFNSQGGCWIGVTDSSRCEPGKLVWVGGGRSLQPEQSNLTVVGRAADGSAESSHTVAAPGAASRLGAYLDAPSRASGTGSSLVLDGRDAALVRVALEDEFGSLVASRGVNVTVSVFSGPGRVVGVASDDPASHSAPHGGACASYGGLVRAVVQVTTDCMTPNRALLNVISRDIDARTVIAGEGTGKPCPSGPIVVGATAVVNGTTVRATVSIGVSTSEDDAPLAVARSSAIANDNVGAWLTGYQG